MDGSFCNTSTRPVIGSCHVFLMAPQSWAASACCPSCVSARERLRCKLPSKEWQDFGVSLSKVLWAARSKRCCCMFSAAPEARAAPIALQSRRAQELLEGPVMWHLVLIQSTYTLAHTGMFVEKLRLSGLRKLEVQAICSTSAQNQCDWLKTFVISFMELARGVNLAGYLSFRQNSWYPP